MILVQLYSLIKVLNPKKKLNKIIFLIFILSTHMIFNNFDFLSKTKVCLCSPAKKENMYLKEFIEHYKSYNVDNIFLYDNNDINGEHFEEVINDYVKSGYVKIINFRGKKNVFYKMLNDCYKRNYLKYDWLIFYEIDEYIFLSNYNDIKKFLIEDKYNNCETIQLNWIMHTDNNNIYYENKPLKIRFPETKTSFKIAGIKSILKGKIPNITINCVHKINSNLKTCDGFGRRTNISGAGTDRLDNQYYYIDHYFCKSTEEFVNKLNKGDALFNYDNTLARIWVYFNYNKITKEKIDYIKKHLNVNVSLESLKLHQLLK